VAHDLEEKGIAVDLVLTLDPVSRITPGIKWTTDFSKSSNVSRWLNYYERQGRYSLRGHR